jgi:hypothetical protein
MSPPPPVSLADSTVILFAATLFVILGACIYSERESKVVVKEETSRRAAGRVLENLRKKPGLPDDVEPKD